MLLLAAVDGISVCHLYLLQVEEDLDRARQPEWQSQIVMWLRFSPEKEMVRYVLYCHKRFSLASLIQCLQCKTLFCCTTIL
jgi:hypothetical protein